jgi:hypothetical protein
MRPVSLLVVAVTLLGSLFFIEQADTATTVPEAALTAKPLDEAVAVSHRTRFPRPDRPTTVDGAVVAARFAGREVQHAIDRVQRRIDRVQSRPDLQGQACEFLLNARATLLVRIDILIDLVPAAEGRLLGIQARVLARIDAVLLNLDCSVSG